MLWFLKFPILHYKLYHCYLTFILTSFIIAKFLLRPSNNFIYNFKFLIPKFFFILSHFLYFTHFDCFKNNYKPYLVMGFINFPFFNHFCELFLWKQKISLFSNFETSLFSFIHTLILIKNINFCEIKFQKHFYNHHK